MFPLIAAAVAAVFSLLVARQYAERRRPSQLAWAIALAMYAVASFAVVLGVAGGWTADEFRLYWALGAVLNVPFLAGGELMLLVRNRTVRAAIWVALVFLTAYTVSVLRGAALDAAALMEELPSGKHVFGDGSPAHRLPQLILDPFLPGAAGRSPVVRMAHAGQAGAPRTLHGHAVDRPRRLGDRGLRVGVRGARSARGVLGCARGRHHGDVPRLPARRATLGDLDRDGD